MSREKVLELKNVTQCFGGLKAVSDVNITVYQGEVVGLIGPNGAGKTTIFNDITGIYTPTEGNVFYKGTDITGKKVYEITKHGLARTFQNIRLFSELSVIDNVKIGYHIQEKSTFISALFRTKKRNLSEREATEKTIDLLKMANLASKADDKASSLPYGSQRKLEIVRAMATGAELLLLDEPAAGMNGQETEELMAFIRQLQGLGYTIFLIEHDMNLVMNICERIYVQNHGVVIADGTPEEIKNNRNVIDAYLGEEVEIDE